MCEENCIQHRAGLRETREKPFLIETRKLLQILIVNPS